MTRYILKRLAMLIDAAPFALPLPEGNGLLWEDPREIHRVVVRFQGAAPAPDKLRLEYWGSWWPERHLPKDREPGGGDVGWMELGHWYRYGWRTAETEIRADGSSVEFSFRPVNAREYPKLADYPAPFRYTLKIRVVADGPTPPIERIQAFTDSELAPRTLRLAFAKPAGPRIEATAYNGRVERTETLSPTFTRLQLQVLFFLFAIGIPIAFSFLLVNMVSIYLLWGGFSGLEQMMLSVFRSVTNFNMLPVPLFILMGELIFNSGIADKSLEAIDKWIGKIPGRLSLVAVMGGTHNATLSGSSVASTAMLSTCLYPEMKKRGYAPEMSIGPLLGSGGLATMIPPSNLGVVLAGLGSLSVGDMLISIIIPGFMISAIYILYIF